MALRTNGPRVSLEMEVPGNGVAPSLGGFGGVWCFKGRSRCFRGKTFKEKERGILRLLRGCWRQLVKPRYSLFFHFGFVPLFRNFRLFIVFGSSMVKQSWSFRSFPSSACAGVKTIYLQTRMSSNESGYYTFMLEQFCTWPAESPWPLAAT